MPPPARHHNILHRFNLGNVAHVQGFLDSNGDFLTREEARKVAIDACQTTEIDASHPTKLFSENLW